MQSTDNFQFSLRKSSADIDQEAVIRSIKHGSEQEFSWLYNRHVQGLFNYGMHACGDREIVKACLEEFFVLVWEQRGDLPVAISIKSYFFRTFRKLLFERIFNRNKFSVRIINFFMPQFGLRSSVNHDVFTDRVVCGVENDQTIQVFTGRQAEAFFLKVSNLLSYHEVAFIMDLNVATIYNLVSGAVEILRHPMRNIGQHDTTANCVLK